MDAKKKSSSSGTRTLIIPLEEKTLRSDVKNNSFKSPKAIINKYKRLNFFSYVKIIFLFFYNSIYIGTIHVPKYIERRAYYENIIFVATIYFG